MIIIAPPIQPAAAFSQVKSRGSLGFASGGPTASSLAQMEQSARSSAFSWPQYAQVFMDSHKAVAGDSKSASEPGLPEECPIAFAECDDMPLGTNVNWIRSIHHEWKDEGAVCLHGFL